jgi:hypothetical protein
MQRAGHTVRGHLLPPDVLAGMARRAAERRWRREKRDLTIATEGADVKATIVDAASFVELLRNIMVLD